LRRLATANPAPVTDFAGLGATSRAVALLDRIVTVDAEQQRQPAPAKASPRATRRIALAVAGVAILALTGVAVTRTSTTPAAPNMRLVALSRDHGAIIARITDPSAAAAQLDAAFKAHGLDIHVQVLPVSPSLVGTVVFSDFGARSLPTVTATGVCGTESRRCPVGFVIPGGFTGPGDVAVGRAAGAGEIYASSAVDVFGSGEVLHCSGLLGELATSAAGTLQSMGLTAQWDGVNVDRHGSAPAQYIVGGTALSSSTVLLDVNPDIPSSNAYRQTSAHDNRGCRAQR
jgi:hypothetical protein